MTVQEEMEKNKGVRSIEAIGNYVLGKMEEDEDFRNAWDRKERTIKGCLRYAYDQAQKKYLNGRISGSVCVEDSEVYEWVYEYVIDVESNDWQEEDEDEDEDTDSEEKKEEATAEEPKKKEPVKEKAEPPVKKTERRGRPAKQKPGYGEQLTLF